jgi:hypothetical protein
MKSCGKNTKVFHISGCLKDAQVRHCTSVSQVKNLKAIRSYLCNITVNVVPTYGVDRTVTRPFILETASFKI